MSHLGKLVNTAEVKLLDKEENGTKITCGIVTGDFRSFQEDESTFIPLSRD
jgi:hypothetical protein